MLGKRKEVGRLAVEQINMPQLGESVHEGTIVKWLVSVGDRVEKYDPLAEIMTDKVTAEVPSSFSGTIKEILAEEGAVLKVGEGICTIETTETEWSHNEQSHDVPLEETVPQKEKIRYSPAVLKLSTQHGIDLSQVQGTGAGGRITRKDVLKAIEGKKDKENMERPTSSPVEEKSYSTSTVLKRDTIIPVKGVRKVIAANMVRSKTEIPHAWTMIEVDVTNLVKYRNEIKKEFEKTEGFPLTYFPFFVKAVAQTLKQFPQLNSTWEGEQIIYKKEINISIAVATDDALYVPVIKHADEKSIKGIAREIFELSAKARSGKLQLEDTQGGTFTVNNTGTFGSIQSMGIINYPQAAILQVESIVKRPVVIDGMIAIRDIVNLCLSMDHRIVDGLIGGRFLQKVKTILEHVSKDQTIIY